MSEILKRKKGLVSYKMWKTAKVYDHRIISLVKKNPLFNINRSQEYSEGFIVKIYNQTPS